MGESGPRRVVMSASSNIRGRPVDLALSDLACHMNSFSEHSSLLNDD